LDIFYL